MSAHSMNMMLRRDGHEVAALSALSPKGFLGLKNRVLRAMRPTNQFPVDHVLGYPVFRGWQPCLAAGEVIDRFAPDVLIAQSGEVVAIANAFSQEGVPACVFLRHTNIADLGCEPARDDGNLYIANSGYTASFYKERFGLDCPVMPPLVIPGLYRTPTDRSRVLFVNPHPTKGLDIVLRLAAHRPDIPFDIVESWTLPARLKAETSRRATGLGNIHWVRRTGDMRHLYRHARILLVPSSVGHPESTESWGRVVTEAHFSGIPVIASNSGGLPESVGPGGVVIDVNAPFDEWASALALLWDDAEAHARYSTAAREFAGRPLIEPEHQTRLFTRILDSWLADCRP